MRSWRIRGAELPLGQRTVLMGILNVTPDSFSDGGQFLAQDTAQAQARHMTEDGADILDIGGESTRPGARPVDAAEEWRRIAPVVETLCRFSETPVSIDTYKAETAAKALSAGAHIVNDVWGFQRDAKMASLVAEHGAGAVLMHNRDQTDASIQIMDDVLAFLSRSIELALRAGVHEDCIVVDPGVGFGKTAEQSAEVICRLSELRTLGRPILLGASRKRFIGALLHIEAPAERVNGTLGAHIAGVANGADIIRVHDVKEHREALAVFDVLGRKH